MIKTFRSHFPFTRFCAFFLQVSVRQHKRFNNRNAYCEFIVKYGRYGN